MNIKKDRRDAPVKEQKESVLHDISVQSVTGPSRESGKIMANLRPKGTGKTSPNFWASRIFKPKADDGFVSPNYAMRVQFKGRRTTFATNTPNKEAASRIAAGIYSMLLTEGWDATIAKHRPSEAPEEPQEIPIARVGEWIEAAKKISEVNPSTFNCYACSLRKIVGDILSVERTDKRFGPKKGGSADYRASINAAGLDILTQPEVQKWRLEYVKKAKNPAEERSRMTSCNSTIRQARSLFAPKVVELLPNLRLPDPAPFHKVKFFPRQSAKYFSRIDAKTLLQEAARELQENDSPAFLAMLLAMSAGLRKGEIDSLQWHQVDFSRQLIRVETTEAASLKTTDSRDEVPLDEGTIGILRGFHARKTGPFVIEADGNAGGPKKWGQHYRADAVFDKLNTWLRAHGVTARKPLHELRKELGALVTAEHGIYAASRVLRHADVAITAAHYSDLKTRPVIGVGSWLTENQNIKTLPEPVEFKVGKRGSASAGKRVGGAAV
jgi:integrase